MNDHQWIQISNTSATTICELIRTGHAQPSQRKLSGIQGSGTWQLTAQADVTILSDEHLLIAGQLVKAQLSHLSTHTYRSLILGSTLFTQYPDIDELYRQVRQPPEGWNAASFAQQLEQTVRAGRQPDLQPRLVVTPTTYTARWKPGQIYLRKTKKGLWFLALCFDVRHIPGRRHPAPVPIGLDLGLQPMTVACTGPGKFRTFKTSSLKHLRAVTRCGLTSQARDLLAKLAYASGREDAQQIIAYLNWRGSRVYAEKLELYGMNGGYIQTSRDLGIQDHHFAHLPQFMRAAGHLFKRPPAYYTSQHCAYCYVNDGVSRYGDRQGDQLRCHHCKQTYNCHEVASWNIRIIGEEEYGPNPKPRR
ncbi:hypothetical protein GCM10022631_25980 [Deinococcus rubellus]